MESNELRFRHVGLSSDGAVVFCELDNGKTYAMPLCALEKAANWDHKARPKGASIIHDGYAVVVEFDTGLTIDFPSDFVLHVCEPTYPYYKAGAQAVSGVGGRIRQVRKWRGLTLDALAAKCGIAKPNLSRLENNKVTPTLTTINHLAAALHIHPALLVSVEKPKDAWTWTQHAFTQWKLGLLWNEEVGGSPMPMRVVDMVDVFLAMRPEHGYAKKKLFEHAVHSLHDPELSEYTLDAKKWARELASLNAALKRTKRQRSVATKTETAGGRKWDLRFAN